MIFSSIEFIIFFLIFCFSLNLFKNNQKIILVIFSLFFYAYWNPIFVSLIIYLSLLTYLLNRFKISLPISFLSILLPLIYFKYSNFIFKIIGFEELINLAYQSELPLAISFITFTALAFVIDAKNKKFTEEISFISFLEFIAYFPQLIAGPILRANELIPELKKKITFEKDNIKFGLLLFLIGFIKKVYFADNIGLIIDPIFADSGEASEKDLIKGFLLFPLQIYFDFSGYVDMALGVSKILSIDLPINFNKPYLTTSLTDFWRNWHITLSNWFRDYIYIPLGGSKRADFILFFNLILTMSIAGLWHGANFNFIIWGAINGLFLFLEKKITFKNFINKKIKIFLNCFLIFNLWLIFRIQDLSFFIEYFINLYLNFQLFFITENLYLLLFVVLAIISQKYDNYFFIQKFAKKINLTFVLPILILIIFIGLSFNSGTSDKFIYFNF